MRGFTRVIIIEALKSPAEAGREPGEVARRAHSIGLDTALELGHRLGCDMPGEVIVFAIEATDVETFGEQPSPPAAAAERALHLVRRELGA